MGSGEAQGPLLVHLAAGAAGVSEVTLGPHKEPERTQKDAFSKKSLLHPLRINYSVVSGSVAATNPADLLS